MIRRKLHERRGTTLSEMLVAVAILGLVTLAVSVGVTSSLRVYRDSVALSNAQILVSTISQALLDDLRFARDIEMDGTSGEVVYTSPNYGLGASVKSEDGRITVGDYELLGSGAYAGLSAGVDVAFQDGMLHVELEILDGSATIRTAGFSVRPLNTQPSTEEWEWEGD